MSDTSRFVEGVTYEVKRRGGTTLEHASFIGNEREITVDTTKNTVVVHDGKTPGGHPLATEAAVKALEEKIITGGGEVDLEAIKDELRAEFRPIDTPIHEDDLGDDVKTKLEIADGLQTQITSLINNKVDRTELVGYRKTSVAIEYDDLDPEVQAKLDSTYSDVELKQEINNLQTIVNNKVDQTVIEELTTVIENKADATDISNLRSKYEAITEADLDTDLVAKINAVETGYDDTAVRAGIQANVVAIEGNTASIETLNSDVEALKTEKADVTALEAYRQTSVAIAEADLDAELVAKINAGSEHYDDSAVQQAITDLQNNKADKVVLDDYRLKSDAIVEDDLDEAVIEKLNYTYDDTALQNEVTRLDNAKADKVTLDQYRLKSDEIVEEDLTQALINKINAAATGYDDSELRNLISAKADVSLLDNYLLKTYKITLADLDTNLYEIITGKADASELANYRAKNETITKADLDTTVINEIDAKVDEAELTNYRANDVAITEADLDEALAAKINAVETGYDDSELRAAIQANTDAISSKSEIIEDLSSRISTKADESALENYRLISDKITEDDLTTELVDKINDKVDPEALENYRLISDKITEDDLDEVVVDKLNSAVDTGYVDTIFTDLQKTIATKADTAALEDYRLKSDPIGETDLTTELADKINDIYAGIYDDTELRTIVNAKLNVDVAADTYRAKADAITEADLDEALVAKINAVETGYDDTEVKNLIQNNTDSINSNTELIVDLANRVEAVESGKADKTELEAYRQTSVSISEEDLTTELAAKINGAVAGIYDDTEIRTSITELQEDKLDADIAAETYRAKANAIAEEDLTDELAEKINNAANNSYDDTEIRELINNKIDSTVLANYRSVNDPIAIGDLDEELAARITAGDVYNDAEIRNLIDAKLDVTTAEETYRTKSVAITETDLDTALAEKINAGASYNDTEIRELISAKLDALEAGTLYRAKTDAIAETDLTTELVAKINGAVAGIYDDTEVRNAIETNTADINSLEEVKADKTELEAYRLTATKITEDDLDDDLKAKINSTSDSTGSSVDLSEYENRIKALEMKNPEVIYFDLGSPGGTTWKIEDITDIPESWYDILTNANIYGFDDDGNVAEMGRRVKLFCLGPNNHTVPNPIELPLVNFDDFTVTVDSSKNPYSNWIFDSTQGSHGAIIFGTASTAEYRLKFEFYPYTFVE